MITIRKFNWAAGLAFGSLVAMGCGGSDDDGNGVGVDANGNGDVDANGNGGVTADACEPGHGVRCGGIDLVNDVPEGGEFRIETKEIRPHGALALHSTEAFLFTDQQPENREILGVPTNDGEPYADGTRCWHKDPIPTWNAITSQRAQDIHETRTYLDAGETVFMEAVAGGPREELHDDYELLRYLGESGDKTIIDALGRSQERTHGLIYRPAFTWVTTVVDGADPSDDPDQIYDPHYFTVVSADPDNPVLDEPLSDADQNPTFDVFDPQYRGDFRVPASAFYKPVVVGSAEVPEFRATDGWSVPDNRDLDEADFLLWHPTRFTMVNPPEEEYVTSGGSTTPSFAMVEGEDFVFEIDQHDAPSTVPSNAPGTVNWIATNRPGSDGLDYFCLQTDKDADTITLPAEAVDAILNDDSGSNIATVTIGKVSHAMWAHVSRSLHAVGVTCKVGRGCVNEVDDEGNVTGDCLNAGFAPGGELTQAEWDEIADVRRAAIREVFGR